MVLRTRSRGTVAGLIAVAMIFATGIGLETPPSAAASGTQTRTISATLAGTSTITLGSGLTLVEVTSSGRVRGAPRAHLSAYSFAVSVAEAQFGFATGGSVSGATAVGGESETPPPLGGTSSGVSTGGVNS